MVGFAQLSKAGCSHRTPKANTAQRATCAAVTPPLHWDPASPKKHNSEVQAVTTTLLLSSLGLLNPALQNLCSHTFTFSKWVTIPPAFWLKKKKKVEVLLHLEVSKFLKYLKLSHQETYLWAMRDCLYRSQSKLRTGSLAMVMGRNRIASWIRTFQKRDALTR